MVVLALQTPSLRCRAAALPICLCRNPWKAPSPHTLELRDLGLPLSVTPGSQPLGMKALCVELRGRVEGVAPELEL